VRERSFVGLSDSLDSKQWGLQNYPISTKHYTQITRYF